MGAAPALIGVDWGTSSFRAYLIDANAEIISVVDAPEGILTVKDQDFEGTFERLLSDWLGAYPLVPVILSGMITSRNGWHEVEYTQLPAKIHSIASNVVPFDTTQGRKIYFVGGLVANEKGAAPDVIRGEETELIGQIIEHQSDGVFLLPGTHNKWVRVIGDEIIGFETFMTGELFAILKDHSILGTLMTEGGSNEASFSKGILWDEENASSILHHLFSVRTLPLFGEMKQEDVADFLSGLLIGEEISGAKRAWNEIKNVTIIGRGDLADKYAHALSLKGFSSNVASQSMVARGHFELAQLKGLI